MAAVTAILKSPRKLNFIWNLNLAWRALALCSNILMLIKRPPLVYTFVDNNYIHEHVMITKLYIVVHILYDRHLYESIP